MKILSLATNIPGPVAVARLAQLGGSVTKFEPPSGDALSMASPPWYEALHQNVTVERVNLKTNDGVRILHERLADCDLLVTATRPAALRRLGISWPDLADKYPRLCQVAIIGRPPPNEDKAGHDLTYQAKLGLVNPPQLPKTVLADLAGAEWAVSAALSLLLNRYRAETSSQVRPLSVEDRIINVYLEDAAKAFAAPLHHGLTSPGGLLNGTLPVYNLYQAEDGWLAIAALEPHFMRTLASELCLETITYQALAETFRNRSAEEWESWAVERDLPIVAVSVL